MSEQIDARIKRYDPRWRQQATDPNEVIVIERKKADSLAKRLASQGTSNRDKRTDVMHVRGGRKVNYFRDSRSRSNTIHIADIYQAIHGKRPSESLVIRRAVDLLAELYDELLVEAKEGKDVMSELLEELELMDGYLNATSGRSYEPTEAGTELLATPTRSERWQLIQKVMKDDIWKELKYGHKRGHPVSLAGN